MMIICYDDDDDDEVFVMMLIMMMMIIIIYMFFNSIWSGFELAPAILASFPISELTSFSSTSL